MMTTVVMSISYSTAEVPKSASYEDYKLLSHKALPDKTIQAYLAQR